MIIKEKAKFDVIVQACLVLSSSSGSWAAAKLGEVAVVMQDQQYLAKGQGICVAVYQGGGCEDVFINCKVLDK